MRSEPEDGRYRYLREHWQGHQGKFFLFYMAQALLVVRWPQGASVELHVDPAAPGVAELVRSLLGPCSH